MSAESSRRNFLITGSALAGGLATGTAAGQDKPPEHKDHGGHPAPGRNYGPEGPDDRWKLTPGRRKSGDLPVLVETPDNPTKLKWEMKNGVKEFHLRAGHLKREFLPNQWFDVWGYNGSMPGPTIEAVEGDRVRFVVHNDLPESTTVHWHGLELPAVMDGIPGLTQDPIPAGGTFTYEFDLKQNGTFFYHTHGAMQEGMGMAGLFIIHPKVAWDPPVDRDFGLLIQEWAILPGSTVPNTMSMEFNLFTINGRAAPYVTPLVVRQGERVRIRMVNMSAIDQHPMHLHGFQFWLTGTEAGRLPVSAWVARNTVIVGVAQAQDVEFVAHTPGDWLLHCHMFHHMMNFMSSMVGPMGGHTVGGMPAGGSMATGMGMITQGPALNPEFGAQLGRGTGEQTGNDRTVGNMAMPGMAGRSGMGNTGRRMGSGQEHGQHGGDRPKVPGYPQDMFEMISYPPDELKKLNASPLTRGFRRDWYKGVEGLMTVIRVLPPDLYEKVVSGTGDVPPGASVPGAGPGDAPGQHKMPGGPKGHEGHSPAGGGKKDPAAKGHEGHKKD
ncbi:MAG: copper oxidase [Gemmataceae bacterium]|nr:copper oxidase [Gemmataceae bacterium]